MAFLSGAIIEIIQEKDSLRIKDTGEGISSEDLPNVYNRNFTTKSSGAGMGLSLIKKLCERVGWAISIESEVGEGTTVDIFFD